MIVHTHLAESPGEGEAVLASVESTAARYFARVEVLGPRLVAAHGIWLDDDELDLLAERDAALVHCPSANFKLGSGLANVRAWKDNGIRCGLGADGAACNNRLDTFHEMSLAAKVSRVTLPARHLSDREVMQLATIDGARALGLDRETGSLEVGKAADVAVIDVRGAHQGPNATNDPYTTLVHATHAGDVRATLVAGRILYKEGACTTLDAVAVLRDAEREARDLRARAAEAAS
jgi:5-methylthioadenosine/S-adenosylhomocysteine deaminase